MKEGFPLHPLRRKLLAPSHRPKGAARRRGFSAGRTALKSAFLGEREGYSFLLKGIPFAKPRHSFPFTVALSMPYNAT